MSRTQVLAQVYDAPLFLIMGLEQNRKHSVRSAYDWPVEMDAYHKLHTTPARFVNIGIRMPICDDLGDDGGWHE